jgi:hypothetical protein
VYELVEVARRCGFTNVEVIETTLVALGAAPSGGPASIA